MIGFDVNKFTYVASLANLDGKHPCLYVSGVVIGLDEAGKRISLKIHRNSKSKHGRFKGYIETAGAANFLEGDVVVSQDTFDDIRHCLEAVAINREQLTFRITCYLYQAESDRSSDGMVWPDNGRLDIVELTYTLFPEPDGELRKL